jgi:hypothetical protein
MISNSNCPEQPFKFSVGEIVEMLTVPALLLGEWDFVCTCPRYPPIYKIHEVPEECHVWNSK